MDEKREFFEKPTKIIVTLTPSIIFNYPINLLVHKISVLRFQRSLCDPRTPNDGLLSELGDKANGALSTAFGIFYTKDIAIAILKKHGLRGFFRYIPEYAVYHLLKDLLRYLVPNYVIPYYTQLRMKYFYDIVPYTLMDVTNNLKLRYMHLIDKPDSVVTNFVYFFATTIEAEIDKIVMAALVEFFSYPVLTVISRLMVFDGLEPLTFASLLGRTLSYDGLFSLYRGFTFYLMANAVSYISRNFNKFAQSCIEYDFYMSPVVEQALPVFLSITHTVVNQFSLILRCGSNVQGLCMPVGTDDVLKKMPWSGICTQMLLTLALLHFKEKLLAKHMRDLNTHFNH